MLGNQISAMLQQAKLVAKISNDPVESLVMQALFITPKEQISSLGVDGFVELADFTTDRSTNYQISVRLQPGTYFNKLVPFRDDLEMHLLSKSGTDSVLRKFDCIPLQDKDVVAESNNTASSNIDALDNTNLVSYKFQLIEQPYNAIKNQPVSNIFPISNITDVLKTVMEGETKKWSLTGENAHRGTYIVEPVDNLNNYRQIEIPHGTLLKDVPAYLQSHNEYGVYTKGLCAFYKQRYWWITPLFNTNLVDTHHRPIDLIRVPENKIPDLQSTFYMTDASLTIIAAGKSIHKDFADIRKQNKGVGKKLIMGDAIAGDTGSHYNNGRSITTRADTMQEYMLSERRDGNEHIPIDRTPTGNICKAFSENAFNEGEMIVVEWRNGDVGYLEPCHPIRYQYLDGDDSIKVRKGILLGYRSDYIPITNHALPLLKRTTMLHIFLKRQDQYKVPEQ